MPRLLSEELGGDIYCVHRLDRAVVGVMVYARTAAAAATAGSSCTSGSSVWHRFLFIPTPPDTEKQGRLMPSDLAVLYCI